MGLLKKLGLRPVADKNDPGGSGFKDNVHRENKGLLGKLVKQISPDEKRRGKPTRRR